VTPGPALPVPVLMVIHSLGHGGSERQLTELARSLDRSRFQPHVASVDGGFRVDELRAAGIPVFRIPIGSLPGLASVEAARHLRRYIRAHRIALVHAFDYGTAFFAVGAARGCGVIALSSQRFFMDSVPLKYRLLTRAAHRLAHGVVANSHAAARHLTGHGFPSVRVHVCPNGIDVETFHPEPRERLEALREAPLVIGTASVLRPEKNIKLLLQAFARIRDRRPEARLLIVGGGSEDHNLRQLAARLGVASHCVFLPVMADVRPALRSTDIFVHASLTEGMPNAVMEAMACGCAVVATRVGGTPELIDHGLHGLLAEPGNRDDLVAQIERLISQPGERKAMALAASERMRDDFSLAASARRLERIYAGFLP
jgi:glycosyltransferase involved in cell wall biosynthesis